MNFILESKILKNGDTAVLASLDNSWEPWEYQINIITLDGKDYGRPGVSIRTGMHNFRSWNEAETFFQNLE